MLVCMNLARSSRKFWDRLMTWCSSGWFSMGSARLSASCLMRMQWMRTWHRSMEANCDAYALRLVLVNRCHAPNMFGTMDIGIMSPAFWKLKSFFKNIFIGLEHLELRKRKITDIIPHTGYYKSKKDSDANDMTVQQYYHETYNIHIK